MFYVLDEFTTWPYWDEGRCVYKYHECAIQGPSACGRIGPVTMILKAAKGIAPMIGTPLRIGCTEYALRMFRKWNITGWRLCAERVRVVRRGVRRKVPRYYEIEVVGKAVSIAHSEGVRLLKVCPDCGNRDYSEPTNGIQVAENQWDGSDMFWAEETHHLLVSEKFAEMVRRKRLRGLSLIPATEWRDRWAYLDRTPPPPGPPEDLGPVIKMLRERERRKRERA